MDTANEKSESRSVDTYDPAPANQRGEIAASREATRKTLEQVQLKHNASVPMAAPAAPPLDDDPAGPTLGMSGAPRAFQKSGGTSPGSHAPAL